MGIVGARGKASQHLQPRWQGYLREEKGKTKTRNEPQPDHQAGRPLHAHLTSGHLLSLEPDDRVIQQVSEIQLPALLDDVAVLAHEEPADVGEEEAAAGVVRVRVRL